jgi:LPXTG-motif cell wall-anchored protein
MTVTLGGYAQPNTSGTPIASVTWQWGDGQTTTGSFPQSHTYSRTGTCVITVTVTDSVGHTAASSVTISVSGTSTTSSQITQTIANTSIPIGGGSSNALLYVVAGIVVAVVLVGVFFLLRKRRKAAPKPTVVTQSTPEMDAKLQRLKQMLDSGLITQADYEEQKRKLGVS